jgi:DNA-binding transcriptional regulator GbsR (MarR family)
MGIRKYFDEIEETEFSLDKLFEADSILPGSIITDKPMTGAEIARELNISRQAVSNNLKRAMTKVYTEVKKGEPSWGAFETAVAMSQMFGVEQDSPEELKKFFKLFPPKIRKEIEADAFTKLGPATQKKLKK